MAFDRVLATEFGVRAFEMVLEKRFGEMVAYREAQIISVPFTEVINRPNNVNMDGVLVKTAKGVGISFGD